MGEVGGEGKKAVQIAVVVLGVVVAAHFLWVVFQELESLTGMASTSSGASVQIEVLSTNATAVNVTNLTGGNFGGGRPGSLNVETSMDMFEVSVREGEVMQKVLRVKNTGDVTLTLFFSSENGVVTLGRSSAMLAPGESVEVVLTFVAEEEGVFIDVIRIRSSLVEKAVPIIISVSSRGADFSLLFNLDEDSYVVGPEGQIESSLVAEGLHGGSMELRYVMMDAEGKILHEEIAEVDVVDKMSILKSMRVP